MEEPKVIITISGSDKVGIVHAFTGVLAEHNANIEDIRQTIMQDHFVMILMANVTNLKSSFQDFKTALIDKGSEMGMDVHVQRKKIFDKMHTI